MDAKSGIFSAPLSGAYMFTVHACAHDQHKALLTLRKNGIQVASFYDQVGSHKHYRIRLAKNSQSIRIFLVDWSFPLG